MDQRRRRRRTARGRKQSRRRRKRNLILKTGFFIIVIIAAVAAFFLWRRYGPSDEQADRNEYYGIESDGQLAIVVNNEILEPRGMISDGRAYVEYATVRDYINSRFYWDPGENVLLYTLPTDTVRQRGRGSQRVHSRKSENEHRLRHFKDRGKYSVHCA